jgi:hypothetical protein
MPAGLGLGRKEKGGAETGEDSENLRVREAREEEEHKQPEKRTLGGAI